MSERERLARIEYDHPPAAYRTSDASESEKAAMLETEVERLLGQLTLEEKVSLCHANSKFAVAGVDRLQIKPMWMSDGPHGVRNEISFDSWAPAGWDTDFATYLPVLSGVAASFNIEMASLHGSVLGSEARERKKDIILGPGVNMVRTPICGRNFEYCGEDPYLAGKIAASEIRAIQNNIRRFARGIDGLAQLNDRYHTTHVFEHRLEMGDIPAGDAVEKDVFTARGVNGRLFGVEDDIVDTLLFDSLNGCPPSTFADGEHTHHCGHSEDNAEHSQ